MKSHLKKFIDSILIFNQTTNKYKYYFENVEKIDLNDLFNLISLKKNQIDKLKYKLNNMFIDLSVLWEDTIWI